MLALKPIKYKLNVAWLRSDRMGLHDYIRHRPDIGASQDIEDASHPARRELQRLLKRIGDTAGLSDKDADLAKVESLFVERLKEREVELQHLKYEHHDADAKNAQLRNALRASASALQHAATLMPPDIGIDIQEDEYLTQIQELQRQVVDKDNRILELLKGTNSAQTLAARLGHSCGVVMCRRPRVARK
eukprot:symbB.v1.2.008490.t1/scaffold535.1/size190655/10